MADLDLPEFADALEHLVRLRLADPSPPAYRWDWEGPEFPPPGSLREFRVEHDPGFPGTSEREGWEASRRVTYRDENREDYEQLRSVELPTDAVEAVWEILRAQREPLPTPPERSHAVRRATARRTDPFPEARVRPDPRPRDPETGLLRYQDADDYTPPEPVTLQELFRG